MTDDELLCSEADLAHLKMRTQILDLQSQMNANMRQQLRMVGQVTLRLAEPATDPYEIEKE